MNVYEARVVVRERTVAEIVDLTVRFALKLGGGLYARLCLYFVLPAYALCHALLAYEVADVWLGVSLVVLFPLLQLPFMVAASRLMFSSELTVREVLVLSGRVLVGYSLAQFAALLLQLCGGLLVVLLPAGIARGLYLGEIVVLEGSGLSLAVDRGRRLTVRRTAQTFMVWLALGGVVLAMMVVGEICARSLASEGVGLAGYEELWGAGLINAQGRIAGLLLSAPLVATLRFLAYIDNRTRREGWDVQVRFLELARNLEASS